MKPTNKLLGVCAMLAAPFLTIMLLNAQTANASNTSLSGLFGLIYMAGWMGSIIGLIRLKATGTAKTNTVLLYIELAFLCVANIWNIWVMVDPTNNSALFFVLDMFWPLSNVFMLVLGIVIAVKGIFKGWHRYVVLIVGLWLPFSLGTMMLMGRENNFAFYPGCIYSVIAWTMLGWMIYSSKMESNKLSLQKS